MDSPAEKSALPENGADSDSNSAGQCFQSQPDDGSGYSGKTSKDTGIWDFRKRRRINRYVLMALLVVLAIAAIPIFRVFFVPIILAATFSTLIYPAYDRMLHLFKGKRALSALTCCMLLLFCLIIPTYILVHLVVLQIIDLYQSGMPITKELMSGSGAAMAKIKSISYLQLPILSSIDWQALARQIGGTLAGLGTFVINRTSAGLLELLATLFITLFTMFYFLIDGKTLLGKLKYLSPLRDDYEEIFFTRFLLIARATVGGTLVIGLTQGTLGGLTLLIFGVNSWLLWGFAMIILSLLPVVGSWIVLVPAGIVRIVMGHPWQGIGILIVSVLVISNIDNLIRPRLVGRGARMHDLLILFSTLGGITVFGVMGFIIGPVIIALFVAAIDLYQEEFRSSLDALNESRRNPLP